MSLNGAMFRVGTVATTVARGALTSHSSGAALAIMTRRNMTTFQERERGEEAVYMRKEDQKLLRNLLNKEKSASAGTKDEKAELMAILGGNKLPTDVIDRLLVWKSS
eukprot:g14802.t1